MASTTIEKEKIKVISFSLSNKFTFENKSYFQDKVKFWELKENEVTEDLKFLFHKSKSWNINFINI